MKPAVFLAPDETLATAARKLRKDNIGCLPVCQDGRLLGMITDRDIAMRSVADNRDPNHMRVRDAMSVDAICCLKEDSAEEAATLMRQAHVQRLAVVNADRRLVGIISMSDLEGGGSERRPFEVIFYKEILGHSGLPHHSELMRVSVAQGTKDEAVQAAIGQFEEATRVKNWTTAADGYDVVSIHVGESGESLESLELTSKRDAEIQPRARVLWEQAGSPEGQDVQFWETAARGVDGESKAPK
ncbi:CBS domain-containing protein [Caballeronia arationis]|uniref:CBS domain-containing protein n=1 Tax=Caballeronia arationis TaxID=1777142 RepID=UPI001F31AB6E|nr:CBS domain-containing protein [Caballeronia arationis]